MAVSFMKYRWKESLLWFLYQCTQALVPKGYADDVGDPQIKPEGVPEAKTFLSFIDATSAIPFASNPHAIFVFLQFAKFCCRGS